MIQKAMLSAADKVYILADSSKFEQSAMLKVSDLRSGLHLRDGQRNFR